MMFYEKKTVRHDFDFDWSPLDRAQRPRFDDFCKIWSQIMACQTTGLRQKNAGDRVTVPESLSAVLMMMMMMMMMMIRFFFTRYNDDDDDDDDEASVRKDDDDVANIPPLVTLFFCTTAVARSGSRAELSREI